MEYTFIIKDKRYAGFRKLASFLFLINAVIFVSFALNTDVITSRIIFLAVAAILLGYTIFSWYHSNSKDKLFIPVYLMTILVWITDTDYWYFSFVLLLLLVLQYKMQKQQVIQFSREFILISGFTNTKLSWKELDNVILRDGLLTLDFQDNKILHAEPENLRQQDYPVLEKEFNEFCQQRLARPN